MTETHCYCTMYLRSADRIVPEEQLLYRYVLTDFLLLTEGQDVAQAVEHSAMKVWILLHDGSILRGRCICSLGYVPSKAVVCDILSVGNCI